MNILFIDIGNSRIKWAYGLPPWRLAGSSLNADFSQLLEQLRCLPRPEAIHGCTVAQADVAVLLAQFCQAQWGLDIEWLKVSRAALGISNHYRHLEQQGPDRWAAVLGARSLFPARALVIASAGTALTVDALSEDNDFLGGMILPGLRLMKSALAQQTARLTFSEGAFHDFPRCTTDAIETGCITAMVGSIMAMYERLARRGEPPLCVMAGGDATLIATHLPYPTVIAEQLVLHGLAALAQEPHQ